jgi:hypothetical protein
MVMSVMHATKQKLLVGNEAKNILYTHSASFDNEKLFDTHTAAAAGQPLRGEFLHGEEVLEEGFADLRVEEATDAPELDVEEVEEVSE